MNDSLKRREFLRVAAGGAALGTLRTTKSAKGFAANERVNLAWIGLGIRGPKLLQQVVGKLSDRARVTAVCDLIPEKVERAQKIAASDKPKGYNDFREMMDREKLDGVIVATEPAAHASVVVPVLERNIHCFGEKPLDTTVETTDAIVVAARRARCIFQVGTQRRYSPTHIAGIGAVHAGRIGKIIFMQGHWHHPDDVANWKVARDGGRFIEQASHHTDIMAWAMGEKPPLCCTAVGFSQARPPEGPNMYSETQSAVSFEFPGGVIFSYTHLFGLPRKFKEEKLWIFGETGMVDLTHGMLYPRQAETNQPSKGAAEERIAPDVNGDGNKGMPQELEDFVDNIRSDGQRKPKANIETARIASLMCIMGRMAMVNAKENRYEPRVVTWSDLKTQTDRV